MTPAVLLHPLRFHRDHRFTRTQASAYLDGELGADDRGRVDSHTHLCPPCARFMAGLRRTVSALGWLRDAESRHVGVSDGAARPVAGRHTMTAAARCPGLTRATGRGHPRRGTDRAMRRGLTMDAASNTPTAPIA